MKVQVLIGAAMLGLSGCAMTEESFWYQQEPQDTAQHVTRKVTVPNESGLEYRPDSRDQQMASSSNAPIGYRDPLVSGFSPTHTHKVLGDYAEQLAMELMDKSVMLNQSQLIGVASFVRLNHNLREPTVLGNQLAEYLITELQTYGVGVVDYKLAEELTITPYGDLALSRASSDLPRSLALDHIVTGTMIERPRGVQVNARIISIDNQRVVASANVFIPAFIVTDLNSTPVALDDTD